MALPCIFKSNLLPYLLTILICLSTKTFITNAYKVDVKLVQLEICKLKDGGCNHIVLEVYFETSNVEISDYILRIAKI